MVKWKFEIHFHPDRLNPGMHSVQVSIVPRHYLQGYVQPMHCMLVLTSSIRGVYPDWHERQFYELEQVSQPVGQAIQLPFDTYAPSAQLVQVERLLAWHLVQFPTHERH